MVLQAVTGFGYQVVSHGWAAASILVKYYILAFIGYVITQRLDFEEIQLEALKQSRLVITGLVILGTVLYVTGTSLSPVAKTFSELIALLYLAYLFWMY